MVRCLLFLGLLGACAWLGAAAWAQPTPPVMPKIEEVQLPAPVLLPPPAEPSEAAPQGPLTAAEAAAIALHNQPALAAATANLHAAAGRTRAALAPLKTQVVVTGAINRTSDGGSGGGPSDYTAAASLKRLLYDYDHTRELVRQAQAQENLAQAVLTTAQANLVAQVKGVFYGLVQANRLITVAESNVRNQRQHLAMTGARLETGLGLPYDVVRAQTAYADAVDVLTVARNNAALATVALAQLMGLDPRTPLVPAEGSEAVATAQPVEALTTDALAVRPEMIQTDATIAAARHALAAAQTVSAPVVTGNVGVSTRNTGDLPRDGLMTVGVSVQWAARDGGLMQGKVQEAQANLDAALAQQQQVRLQVIAEVAQAHLNLQTAQLRIATTQAGVTNATEALRLAEGRYRAGLGVFIDVLDAQAALDAANTRQVNAQTAVDQARATLERAVGRNLSAFAP